MNNTVRQSNSHNDQLAIHTHIYEHERTHLLHIFVFYYQHKALILHLQMIVELEGGMVHYILPFIQFKLNTDQNEIQLWTFYLCTHRENIHIAMWTNRLLWTSSTLLIWSHKCGNEQFHLYSSKMLKTIIMQNSLSLSLFSFSLFHHFICISVSICFLLSVVFHIIAKFFGARFSLSPHSSKFSWLKIIAQKLHEAYRTMAAGCKPM